MRDADHAKDPTQFVIPESLRQTEDEIFLGCVCQKITVNF